MHTQSNHTPIIKCESCDETFENNCELESHIERSHDSVKKFEGDNVVKDSYWNGDLKTQRYPHHSKRKKVPLFK